jgi:hypothetical protein
MGAHVRHPLSWLSIDPRKADLHMSAHIAYSRICSGRTVALGRLAASIDVQPLAAQRRTSAGVYVLHTVDGNAAGLMVR